MRGTFITFEGSEGSGKSSGAAYIKEKLELAGREVLLTREPGGTELGDVLRDIILMREDLHCTAMAELLLVFAARAQHIEKVIEPALVGGQVVLCDRFTEASYAYQGAGRSLGAASVATLESLVHSGLQPDITLLLDVPPSIGLARAAWQGSLDKIERQSGIFFERVRDAYLERAALWPERIRVIDATASIVDVQQVLWSEVSCVLGVGEQ